MKWTSKFSLFLAGFMIGQSILPLTAQRPLGLNELQMFELQMQTEIRHAERDKAEREAAKRKAEFEADQKHFLYTQETAALWLTLVQREDEFFSIKYNGAYSFVDAQKHLEVTLIKKELLKRAKDVEKHLK